DPDPAELERPARAGRDGARVRLGVDHLRKHAVGRVVVEERVPEARTVLCRYRRLRMRAVHLLAYLPPEVPRGFRVGLGTDLFVEREDAALPVEQVERVMCAERALAGDADCHVGLV